MDETRLATVNIEEDLGVIFDNKLSFEEHINSKVKSELCSRYVTEVFCTSRQGHV